MIILLSSLCLFIYLQACVICPELPNNMDTKLLQNICEISFKSSELNSKQISRGAEKISTRGGQKVISF